MGTTSSTVVVQDRKGGPREESRRHVRLSELWDMESVSTTNLGIDSVQPQYQGKNQGKRATERCQSRGNWPIDGSAVGPRRSSRWLSDKKETSAMLLTVPLTTSKTHRDLDDHSCPLETPWQWWLSHRLATASRCNPPLELGELRSSVP